MPDKMYINTAEKTTTDWGKIEHVITTHDKATNVHTTFELCRADGTVYPYWGAYDTAPENPKDEEMYIDTSTTPHTLKQYSETNAQWLTIASTYVRLSLPSALKGWTKGFNVGDGVIISGIPTAVAGTGFGSSEVSLSDLNGLKIITELTDEYIVIPGIIDGPCMTNEVITISRQIPEMDFIIESGNRLWGCRYGLDLQGNYVNELYASKLGDFKNWNCFDGISTDSYVASVGTDGQFTGAITHLGYPIFFKDNCMHKVYGNFPANFQVQTTTCRGVQKGCNKSLAIVNEVLYYKSRGSVCMYDGSLPTEISSALGDETYSDAAAGAIRNKYYISMKDSKGEYHLFVFDTKRGLWHREDNTRAIEFCTCRGELYYIDDNKCIKTILPVPNLSYPFESGITWTAESGIIGTDMPDKKYISSLDVRMLLTVGTRVNFFIEYDSCGKWEYLFTTTGTKLQSFAVPIRPNRCDHMRIRIEGDGEAKIFSICKTIEQGSDI